MRISDWSSYVCSSDLTNVDLGCLSPAVALPSPPFQRRTGIAPSLPSAVKTLPALPRLIVALRRLLHQIGCTPLEIQLTQDRKSLVKGKRLSVRVAVGVGRILKNNNN